MLFAAGFGTRMGALTKDRPKPLIEVAGKTLLDHALGLAQSADLQKIVVNTHYLGGQIAAHLKGRSQIEISDESSEILETGGGLRKALPLLGAEPVFTLNSDAVWAGPNPLTALREAWNPATMDALLLVAPKANALGHQGLGDFVTKADRVHRGPGDVYTGAQIIKTDLLGAVGAPAFSLNVIWDQMLDSNRLRTLRYEGAWCDVGRPENIALAERMLADV